MKKIIAMILVLLLTLTIFVACGKDETPAGDTSDTTSDTTPQDAGETGINHDNVDGVENVNQYDEKPITLPTVGFAD